MKPAPSAIPRRSRRRGAMGAVKAGEDLSGQLLTAKAAVSLCDVKMITVWVRMMPGSTFNRLVNSASKAAVVRTLTFSR